MARQRTRRTRLAARRLSLKRMNGEEDTITVFIVAPSLVARAGLESVVSDDANLIITGSAAEIPSAPSVFQIGQTADVVLINVEREKDFDSLLEFTGETESNEINFPAVVALLGAELQTSINLTNALQNNLRGILPHNASANELIQTVKAAAQNLTVLSTEFTETLLSFGAADAPDLIGEIKFDGGELIENLTTREREVLELLVEGESNKRIAHLLNISEHTVKFHVASIFGKLGANTRTEAVTQAIRRGLILL